MLQHEEAVVKKSHLRSVNIDLNQRDVLYVLQALNEFITKCEDAIDDDPFGKDEITLLYADDILHLRNIHKRIKERATPAFDEQGLAEAYESL